MASDSLSSAYSYLMNELFPGILRSDAELFDEVQAFEGNLKLIDHALYFTVPDLFRFVCQLLARNSQSQIIPNRENYLRFRKLLYGNPTNYRLRKLGGRIEIGTSNRKHDMTVYKLTKTFID